MIHGDLADVAAVYEQRDRDMALARMRSGPVEAPMRMPKGIATVWTVATRSPRRGSKRYRPCAV